MGAAADTVRAFLAACASDREGQHQAFRTWFTPQTIWENVGLTKTVGIEDALAVIDGFEAQFGIVAFRADILALAEDGNKVLTERMDYMISADGSENRPGRLMGIFEVEDGRITLWRDYFDKGEFDEVQAEYIAASA